MKTKKPLQQLPSPQLLNQVNDYIINRKNKRHESKRWTHYCLFLLGWKAGLRVSEAINFDPNLEHPAPEYKGLYLLRGKGNKERYVYIAPPIIKVLKSHNWQPQQTNRINFFEFLREAKESLNIPAHIELAPHTLRRCFATYNALNGMPLPVLQNVLGHANVRTTALYVKASRLENLLKFKPV
jgi:site-specific recombinase XerD